MQINCECKPHFIHGAFAEYYVADCLMNRLTEGNNTSQQFHTFILKDIFLDVDYEVIRSFPDGLLSRRNPKKEVLEQYGSQIQDLRTCDHLMLRNAAFEGNVNIIQFLFASVQAGDHRDTIKAMLLPKHSNGFTAWHISVDSNNTHMLEKLWEWAEKKLTAQELKYKFLISRVILNLKRSSEKSWWNTRRDPSMVWRKKIELLQHDIILEYSPFQENTVWHVAAYFGNLKVLEKLWDWAKEKLSAEEINKLLLANNEGRTAWYLAAKRGNIETLQKVWMWAEEKLTRDEITNKFLLGTESRGSTAWQCASLLGNTQLLHKIWELAEKNLTR